ncbi:hypothetical protein [Sphingomonas oryzagri]
MTPLPDPAGTPRRSPPPSGYPCPPRVRLAQAVLVSVACFTAMDIYLISLLVEPIKRKPALSDMQVDLANMTVLYTAYAILCIPKGMRVDRIRRIRLLAAAVFWCAGLLMTGLSTSIACLGEAFPIAGGSGDQIDDRLAYLIRPAMAPWWPRSVREHFGVRRPFRSRDAACYAPKTPYYAQDRRRGRLAQR